MGWTSGDDGSCVGASHATAQSQEEREAKVQAVLALPNYEGMVNLTPHPIVCMTAGGTDSEVVATIPPSGQVARVEEHAHLEGRLQKLGVGLMVVSRSEVAGLPEPTLGRSFIVSSMVADAIKGERREDVYVPYSFVRDEAGRIQGCTALALVR